MIAYIFKLQTEYVLRDFEKALAIREILGLMRKAGVPESVALAVDPDLFKIITTYGNLSNFSGHKPYEVADVESMQVCFWTSMELPDQLFYDLTYIQGIQKIAPNGVKLITPTQVLTNRLPKLIRNNAPTLDLWDSLDNARCNKREHSYLSHSFHSYKGKYYPQLVGSLLNVCGVRPGDWVLEPFAGSGTTLVECSLRGVHSVGIDMNPLARLIAEVKTQCVQESYFDIESHCRSILSEIEANVGIKPKESTDLEQFLPENRAYLGEWFSQEALSQINTCLRAIRNCQHIASQGLCLLTLSDNLRDISYQDSESLRILRRKTPPPPPNLFDRMQRGIEKRLSALEVQKYLYNLDHITPQKRASAHVLKGDARRFTTSLIDAQVNVRFKASITSPPYACALPYIDTDRLSLFALGLLQKGDRAELEWAMIGNREISDYKRRALEEQLEANTASLPESVLEPIRGIYRGNIASGAGFRRLNMGALLYKYFADMQETFAQVWDALEDGAYYVVVIGNSTTKVGDDVVDILTDEWLVQLALAHGFRHCESLEMTDQARYMRHSKNMIKGETIIILRKSCQK